MRAILLDDELRVRRVLRKLLEKNHSNIEIIAEAENVPEAVKIIHKEKPDIIFSDIEMPDYSGFDLLNFISDVKCAVVFVTAHQEYAVKAFEVSAIDYLLKPITEKQLAKTIEKLENHFDTTSNLSKRESLQKNLKAEFITRIALPSSKGLLFVEVDSIMYLIAKGSYTEVVFNDRKSILITKKIKFFEENLDHPNFFRFHRSYIINLNKISQYHRSGYIIMDDGFKISLAKERREQFLEIYKQ